MKIKQKGFQLPDLSLNILLPFYYQAIRFSSIIYQLPMLACEYQFFTELLKLLTKVQQQLSTISELQRFIKDPTNAGLVYPKEKELINQFIQIGLAKAFPRRSRPQLCLMIFQGIASFFQRRTQLSDLYGDICIFWRYFPEGEGNPTDFLSDCKEQLIKPANFHARHASSPNMSQQAANRIIQGANEVIQGTNIIIQRTEENRSLRELASELSESNSKIAKLEDEVSRLKRNLAAFFKNTANSFTEIARTFDQRH